MDQWKISVSVIFELFPPQKRYTKSSTEIFKKISFIFALLSGFFKNTKVLAYIKIAMFQEISLGDCWDAVWRSEHRTL